MAIRAFVTSWSLVSGEIHNPIIDHVDSQPSMGITLSMTYGDADGNGLPDKPTVLVLAESNQITGVALEQLKNLDGVTLIPGLRPDKAMSKLPPSVKADIDGLVAANGIPQSVVNGANTFGDFLGALEKYISPNAGGVAKYIAERPAEFG